MESIIPLLNKIQRNGQISLPHTNTQDNDDKYNERIGVLFSSLQ
jgi:hypothetical protein